ncbi:MAG TPA: alpha/beta hydrolase [Actinoplanes sp.]|nr:alpha/beta hydrolase [Actinoplanes sp.]
MLTETDLTLADGRTLHVYDTGGAGPHVVVWHHGTPNIGLPPEEPLSGVSGRLGIRWVSYDRPGYGGSTPAPGRDIASAAAYTAAVADALGLDRFAVMGQSGGGSHALACGALLPDRVTGVLSISGLAPYGPADFDWFAGMSDAGRASLGAAARGRAAKEAYEAAAGPEDPGFIPADHAALAGKWSWFMKVVNPAVANGPGPLIDDDLAHVNPWGFDPAGITVPVLLLHGTGDRMVPSTHSEWLAARIPGAELRLVPGAGHISVLADAPAALEWLTAR